MLAGQVKEILANLRNNKEMGVLYFPGKARWAVNFFLKRLWGFGEVGF